jgi:folate-binding protein YgfZ
MTGRAQSLDEQVRALEDGRAFVDLSAMRKIRVVGGDAESWLNDLLTARLAGLREGEARRSLLLTPTGRIRADVHVVRERGGFLLLQDRRQPHAIDELLAPYILSSDLSLSDTSQELTILAAPELEPDPAAETFRPSPLLWGVGLVAARSMRSALGDSLASTGITEAHPHAVETRRIRLGRAAFPQDLDPDSLPAEAGLEHLIDLEKGCFLGQESIAKVRNLGHPPRLVVRLRADEPVSQGDPVRSDGRETGKITSVATEDAGWAVLARVRWEDRRENLRTEAGVYLRRLD